MSAFDSLRRTNIMSQLGLAPTDPTSTSASPVSQTVGSVFERIGSLVVPGADKNTQKGVGALVVGASIVGNIIDKASKEAQEREARDKLQKEQRDKEDKQRELETAQKVAVAERQKREQAEALVRRTEAERQHLDEELHRRPKMPRLVLPPPVSPAAV